MFLTRQIFLFSVSLALLPPSHSQGQGSFTCYPCGRDNCYMSKSSQLVNIGGSIGKATCGTLQNGVDDRIFNPQECSSIQQVVLATSNPCGCKTFSGSACPNPGYTNTQQCNLCGGKDLRIGDPYMIIKTGILAGNECIFAFDDNSLSAFAAPSICPLAQEAVQKYCSCVAPGEFVKQCIPQEFSEAGCNPNDPTDKCCIGECVYRDTYRKHVCSLKGPNPIPPSYQLPTPPSPTPRPAASPTSLPFFNTPPGQNECDPNVGCGNNLQVCAFVGGQQASYKCVGVSSSSKSSLSISNGAGGAGGNHN